ncbi:MAG TPA: trigger factor [Vicinamibacteria bacterium]
MKVEYVEESSVKKALSFEIEAETVAQEVEARAKEYARKVKIPGFRPGKIPPSVVKQRLQGEILGDVAEKIVNRVVFQEIEGRGLKPLAAPKVIDLKIDLNQPMTFRAEFETLPIIEVPEYKGLPVKGRKPEAKDEDIDAELDRLREENARFDPVEGRAAQRGDFVLVDLAWRPQGGKGGRDENALIEVGGEGNHEGMNEALVGMDVGLTKELDLTYPEDFPAKSVAGQTLHYVVALKGVKVKVVPARDDEFAKDLDYDDLSALREDIRKRLLASDERKADRELKAALVEALVQRSSFEVPETLVESHMSARTENAARGLALQGIDPTKIGVNWREYRETQRPDALQAAKADILLDEIARREGIEVLEPELESEVTRIAERTKQPREKLRAHMEKEGDLSALRGRLREEKTLDLLKANARIDLA